MLKYDGFISGIHLCVSYVDDHVSSIAGFLFRFYWEYSLDKFDIHGLVRSLKKS